MLVFNKVDLLSKHRVREEISKDKSYDADKWFNMAADMMVLAQAGILVPENYSDSTELRWYKPAEKFQDLPRMPEDDYKSLVKRLNTNPGKRNPETEQDLIDFDNKVLEAYDVGVKNGA